MTLAEAFIKRIVRDALERCPDDMQFFEERIEKGLLQRLQKVLSSDFLRVPYTEAWPSCKSPGRPSSSRFLGVTCNPSTKRFLTENQFQCRDPVRLSPYAQAVLHARQ